jgi:hypothetical protein
MGRPPDWRKAPPRQLGYLQRSAGYGWNAQMVAAGADVCSTEASHITHLAEAADIPPTVVHSSAPLHSPSRHTCWTRRLPRWSRMRKFSGGVGPALARVGWARPEPGGVGPSRFQLCP